MMLPIPPKASYEISYRTGVNATVPVLGVLGSLVGANVDVSVVPSGTGAFQLSVPDGTTVGGNKRGANAIDLQGPSQRTSATQVASAANSVVAGLTCTASGVAAVSMGYGNTASGLQAVALGTAANASANYSAVLGGNGSTASGIASSALGNSATTNSIAGQVTFGHDSPSSGRYQHSFTQAYASTTTTAATVATADGNSGATANQLTLRNNSAFYVHARVVARDTTNNTDAAAWYADLLVIRGANAAATSIAGSPSVTQQYATSGATGWTVAFAADTTNGALKATVTSTTTDTVRWNVSYDTIEVN